MASEKDPRKEGVPLDEIALAREKDPKKKDEIPLDEIAIARGAAQQQSTNRILGAQQRLNNAQADATRDPIYDAIEEAKKQIGLKDKSPADSGQADAEEEKQDPKEEGNASKGILGTVGDKIAGYTKTAKEAVGGSNEAANKDESK